MDSKKRGFLAAATIVTVAAGSYSLGRLAGNDSALAAEGNRNQLIAAVDPSALSMGPNTVADIAQSAAPAVVNIEVVQAVSSKLGFGGMPNIQGMPFNMEFFFNGQRVDPRGGGGPSPEGGGRKFEKRDTGSGFIVRPDGYIVTNAHVVKDAEKIKVTLNDKRSLDAKVVGMDMFSDLAVLKVNATNLPTLKMGTSEGLRPGEFAVAIGSPLGYDHTVTLGIISAVGRTVTDVNGNINFIQTDAAINPGNSGGPLLNLKGEVIGVNTAIRRDAQNIGFSIPVDVAKNVADTLVANGKILRPWLGIQMRELDETVVKSLGLPEHTKGVAIVGFVPGSPAKQAGLQLGDVIQKIDGKVMPGAKEVKEYVQSHKVSDILNFLVLRNNAIQPVAVNVGDYQDMFNKKAMAPAEPEEE